MICPKCSFENPEGERFCSNCGISLAAAPVSAPAAAQPAQKPSASKRRLPVLPIAAVIIIAVAAGAFFLLSSGPAPGGQPPVTPPEQPPVTPPIQPEEAPPLDEYTKEVFTNYTTELTSAMGISGDPFNLGSSEKAKLQSITDALGSPGPVIIFNGQVYNDLEITFKGDTYYLKPKGFTGPESEYLEIIKREAADPEEFFKAIGDSVQEGAARICYRYLLAGNTSILETEMRSYLDSQVSSGVLTGYDYDIESDTLDLSYAGEEIPQMFGPFVYALSINFVVDAYSDPANYANKSLESYRSGISGGDALVINTKGSYPTAGLIQKSYMSRILSPLGNLEKKVAISQMAGNLRFGSAGPVEDYSTPTGMAVGSVPDTNAVISALLDREGVIVPPSKKIYFLEGPDYLLDRELSSFITSSFLQKQFMDTSPEGAFYTFFQNDYLPIAKKIAIGEEAVELFESLISDPGISIFYFSTHGGRGSVVVEEHDLGKKAAPADAVAYSEFKQKINAFSARANKLRARYGDGVMIRVWSSSLETENLQYLQRLEAGIPAELRDMLKSPRKLGVVLVSDKFFNDYSKKKSLILLEACKGGFLQNSFGARVFIASDEHSLSNPEVFASDLKKVSPYLLKDKEATTLQINSDNMRNYNIMNSFVQKQMITYTLYLVVKEAQQSFLLKYRECISKNDQLCNVNLYGASGQTVSVSPHVKSASGDRIEFNAPMNDWNPADSVVTLDASQCTGAPQDALKKKPEWDSSDGYGDKAIKLPSQWKDEVYRDWQESDFDGVTPNVPYATITVSHTAAVSKLSQVQLTGNPDCCTKGGCTSKECWQKPDTIKYNGNQPKTDFVFAMPCIRGDYYKACKAEARPQWLHVKDAVGQQGGFSLPNQIRYVGNCYKMAINPTDAQKEDATPITLEEAKEDKSCEGECKGAPLEDECIKHVLYSIKEVDGSQVFNGNLLVDGVEEPSCAEGQCAGAAAFGDHIAWIKHVYLSDNPLDLSSKSEVVYNRKKYAEGEYIHDLTLYKNHIAYIDTRNLNLGPDKIVDHAFYDGKDMGPICLPGDDCPTLSSPGYILFGDHIAFYNSAGNLVIDGIDQGNEFHCSVNTIAGLPPGYQHRASDCFMGLGDHYAFLTHDRAVGYEYKIDGKSIVADAYSLPLIFGANLAYSKLIKHYSDYGGSYGMVFNGELIYLPELKDARIDLDKQVFKRNYDVCVSITPKERVLEVCGDGIWKYPSPKTAWEAFYFMGGVVNEGMGGVVNEGNVGLWGDKLAFVTESKPYVVDYGFPSSIELETNPAIYYNGGLTEFNKDTYIHDVLLFGDNLVYTLTSPFETSKPISLYLNGAKLAERNEINSIQMFDSHLAFVDGDYNLVYDGINMGRVELHESYDFVLYKDHIGFLRDDGWSYNYDGKDYFFDDMLSIPKNMLLCRQAYIEDEASNYSGEPITTVQLPSFTPPHVVDSSSCPLGEVCGGAGTR